MKNISGVYPILVVAAIIERDGRILLERRAPVGITGRDFKWDLPGGKVECGESPEQALEREIREELNVTIDVGPFVAMKHSVWTYPDGDRHWIVAAYRCSILRGEPHCNENLAWHPKRDLTTDQVMTPDLEMILQAAAALGSK